MLRAKQGGVWLANTPQMGPSKQAQHNARKMLPPADINETRKHCTRWPAQEPMAGNAGGRAWLANMPLVGPSNRGGGERTGVTLSVCRAVQPPSGSAFTCVHGAAQDIITSFSWAQRMDTVAWSCCRVSCNFQQAQATSWLFYLSLF